MGVELVNKNIVEMEVDAIVNAANTSLQMGGGVCGAIFKAAGVDKLEAACKPLAPIRTSESVITDGFDLPAKYIIHTPGPIFNVTDPARSRDLLIDSYRNSINLAYEKGIKSIAFPLISSGIYGYPVKESYDIAIEIFNEFLEDHDMDIYCCS